MYGDVFVARDVVKSTCFIGTELTEITLILDIQGQQQRSRCAYHLVAIVYDEYGAVMATVVASIVTCRNGLLRE